MLCLPFEGRGRRYSRRGRLFDDRCAAAAAAAAAALRRCLL
jgi:hypothetical protein